MRTAVACCRLTVSLAAHPGTRAKPTSSCSAAPRSTLASPLTTTPLPRTPRGAQCPFARIPPRLEAIIHSRGRAITTTAGNMARIDKSNGLLATAIAAHAVKLPRKHATVSVFGVLPILIEHNMSQNCPLHPNTVRDEPTDTVGIDEICAFRVQHQTPIPIEAIPATPSATPDGAVSQ